MRAAFLKLSKNKTKKFLELFKNLFKMKSR